MRKYNEFFAVNDCDPLALMDTQEIQKIMATDDMQTDNFSEQVAIPVPRLNFDMVKKTIEVFQLYGKLFEVRTIPTQGGKSLRCCVKNDEEGINALFKELKNNNLMDKPLYMTLNYIQQDSKCLYNYNKIIPNTGCVKDSDIIRYRWAYVDIDPEHPAGTQATDEETANAKAVTERVRDYLLEQGFPPPVYAFSGNGYSLNFPTDLPNTMENKKLINSFLKALQREFSTNQAKIIPQPATLPGSLS